MKNLLLSRDNFEDFAGGLALVPASTLDNAENTGTRAVQPIVVPNTNFLPWPASFSLAALDGSNGFVFSSGSLSTLYDLDVLAAADVNGDGFSDLIVGAPYSGDTLVGFGKSGGFSASFGPLNGVSGFKITGSPAWPGGDRYAGSSIASGDVNGDGFADVLVGATMGNSAYVVFGKSGGFGATVNLGALDGVNGFQLSAADNVSGAIAVGSVDLNGDGFADIVVGKDVIINTLSHSGKFYVVFGHAGGFGASISLSGLNGSNGFTITGLASYSAQMHFTMGSAGDINGDGIDDLTIRSEWVDKQHTTSGAAGFVVFGRASGFGNNFDLTTLNGSNGFKVTGGFQGQLSLRSAGDINGDGFSDLVVGVKHDAPGGKTNAGDTYVLFGTAGGFPANFDLSSVNGTNGFVLKGIAAFDYSSFSVSSAGDVNGDGFDDLLTGAPNVDLTAQGDDQSGAAYVVFGHAGSFPVSLDLSSLDGTNGFRLTGPDRGAFVGVSVAPAGDVNGDGFGDVLIAGAHDSSVVFGRAPSIAVNRVGTIASQTLAGGASNDTFEGLGGNDSLYGNGGSDTAIFTGAHTDYTIVYAPATQTYTVTDKRAGAPDGVDTLHSVEKLQFSDGTFNTSATSVRNDFNFDDRSDVVFQNNSGQAAVWFMDGQALLGGDVINPNPTAAWHLMATGDFNGDGKPDLLWQHDNGLAAVWLMDGLALSSGNLVGPDPGPTWHIKAAGDFDGDHKSDILWQNDNGLAAVWLMDGLALVGGNLVGPPEDPSWHVKLSGDFNGDGKVDILWQNDNGQAAVWLMDGLNLLDGNAAGPNPGPTWHEMAVGDFDHDGKSDIVWENDTGLVGIWLMNGTSMTGGSVVGTASHAGGLVKAVGDYNSDGNSDILLQNPDGSLTMWLMNFTIVIGSGDVATNPGTSWHVASGDDHGVLTVDSSGAAAYQAGAAAFDLSAHTTPDTFV